MPQSFALLVDIVRSRELSDRAAAQTAVRSAFDSAHQTFQVTRPIWATAGDEFQATYSSLYATLAVTALVRLTLTESLDCRFGIGYGELRDIEERPDGVAIQDGSAWWNARAAIEEGHKLESHGYPYLRTWFVGNTTPDPVDMPVVNAYLHQRDHTISRMKAREKRLAAAMLSGDQQETIARDERITQSAVSQNLQRSGATALAAGLELLTPRGDA